MSAGKDIASFFENGTTEQFEYCYKLYPQVLQLKAEKRGKKPQELIRLDEWYQNDLPKKIKARGKDAHLEYDELVQTMKWKQSRGKFYPQLSYLVKVNTPRAVMTETKRAFRKLPNLEQAIMALSNLKGVGTTMASALLAAAAPEMAPFMADECLMAIPEIEGIDYTTKEYLNFVQHIQTTVARLNAQAGGETPFWSPHRVELALWAHYVANDLSPELLDEMPAPGSGPGGTANSNGKTNSKLLDENSEDNTNDDDVIIGLGANTNATESETDNENTNPGLSTSLLSSAAVDGDSNFVSNDSTSQEQLLDENTTQTNATSTDDGEPGTPLASDSESNIEPPIGSKKMVVNINSKGSQNKSLTPQKLTSVAEEEESQSNDNQLNNSNKSNSSTNNSPHKKLSVVGNANGNGNGNANGSLIVGADSLDGDSSSCALGTDDIVSEMDEPSDVDDGDDDMARMATADDSSSAAASAAVTLSANCSSLTNESNSEGSSSIIGIGMAQKRAHNSNAFVANSDNANSLGEQLLKSTEGSDSSSQPEVKKLRTE